MSEPTKYIVTERTIEQAVKFGLEQSFKDYAIIERLMRPIIEEVERVFEDDCEIVELVRCWNCKHYIKHDKRCDVWNHGVLSCGFCYRGEEKEG